MSEDNLIVGHYFGIWMEHNHRHLFFQQKIIPILEITMNNYFKYLDLDPSMWEPQTDTGPNAKICNWENCWK